MSSSVFAAVPIWLFFIAVIVVIFSAVYVGFVIGQRFRDRHSDIEAPPIGSVIGALFALLAFILALTFSSGSNRHEVRKQLLLDEVNAIGTAFLRASFLESPDKKRSQALLREYVEIRTGVLSKGDKLDELIKRSETIQKELWSIITTYPKGDVAGALTASYANALNDVFDLHTSRVVVGISYHIHSTIWVTLLLISVLSMAALGYQFAYSGGRRVWLPMLLATTFSMVLLLIEDLDRPEQGTIRVNQAPMGVLLKSMSTN